MVGTVISQLRDCIGAAMQSAAAFCRMRLQMWMQLPRAPRAEISINLDVDL